MDNVPKELIELASSAVLPGMYELSLIAASVASVFAIYGAVQYGKPWWEARKMRADKEKEETEKVGFNVWWTIKNMVADGELSVERGEVWARRFAIPCPPVLPNGVKNLKAELQERHPLAEEEEEEPKKVVSLLARLTAARRTAQVS